MAENILQSALNRVRQVAQDIQRSTQDTKGFIQQGRITPLKGAGEALNQAFPGATTRIQQAISGQPIQLRNIQTGQMQTVTQPKLFDVGQQLKGFGEVLSPPDIGLRTKQLLTPAIGAEKAGVAGYGLQGATSYAPSIFGRTERAAALATLSAPTTEAERAALRIGQELPFILGSGALGGLRGVVTRGVQGAALGVGLQGAGNVATGQNFFKDMGKSATEGALSSWKLALTNAITDKVAARIPAFRALTTQNLEAGKKVLGSAITMGSPMARQILANTSKRLFQRALLETPIENTVFTAVNQMTNQDKRKFAEAWIQDLAGTAAGNLLFAGLVTGKRAIVDFNKDVIDEAGKSLVRTGRRLFTDPEFRKGFIKLPEFPEAAKKPAEVAAQAPKLTKNERIVEETVNTVARPTVPQVETQAPKAAPEIEDIIEKGRKQIGKFEEPKKTVRENIDELYTSYIDRFAPIVRAAQKTKKQLSAQGRVLAPEDDPEYLVRRLTGANGIANNRYVVELKPIYQAAKDAGIEKLDLDTYLAQRRIAGFGNVGRDVYGADVKTAREVVKAMEQKYGDSIKLVADKLYQYQNRNLQELVDAGFIDAKTKSSILSQNPDYSPLQRVQDEVDNFLGLPTKKTMQGTQPITKLKGSTKLIESPTENIIANTFKHRAAIEKNRVARAIVDLQGKADIGITPLRVAKNVLERISLYKFAKDIKPLQDTAERLIRSNQAKVTLLQREINRLEKKGLEIALKGTTKKPTKLVSKVKTTTIPEKVRFGKGELADVVVGGTPERTLVEDLYATTKTRGEQSTKNFINALIELPDKAIENLKKRVATRENKLEPLLNDLQSLKNEYEAYKTVRRQTIAEAQLLKDVEAKGKSTLTVWRDGVRELYEVPKDIAETAKGLNEENMNYILRILQFPASILRQGATGRNPEFMIPNVLRDQLDAAIVSKYGYIPLLDWTRGFIEVLKFDLNRKFGTSFDDSLYQRWANSGAQMDLGELSGRKTLDEAVSLAQGKKNIVQWLGTGLDVFGRYSEVPTRLGLFKKAYKKTGNELVSMMESRDLLDYSRMGTKMKVVNSIIPFINVGVQGVNKIIRSVKDDPMKIALNATIYGIAPASALTLYNLQNFPNELAEIPQFEKDTNFVFILGRNPDDTVNYFTIPKGNIVPMFTNPVENFLTYLYGQDSQTFGQVAANVLTQALPVVGEGGSTKEIAIKTFGNIVPQAFKPSIENLLNVSFFKYNADKDEAKNIVPYYLQKELPYKQAYEYTPEMYKFIGATLNVSPLMVQNLLEGYFAGYVKIPSNIIDSLTKISRNEEVEQNKIPILRRFIKSTYPTREKKEEYQEPVPGVLERLGLQVGAKEPGKEEVNVDVIKDKITRRPDLVTANELAAYYLRDISFDPKATEYQKLMAEKDVFGRLSDLEQRENLSREQKDAAIDQMLSKIGYTREQYDYYNISKQNTTIRQAFLDEQIANLTANPQATRADLLKLLATYRVEVNGQTLLSSTMINDLVDAGTLTKAEGTALKEFSVGKAGTKTKLSTKKKKGKAVRVTLRRMGRITAPKEKKITLPTVKLGKFARLKPIKAKRVKLKTLQTRE